MTYIQAEWMLEKHLFESLTNTTTSPTIDLFASRLNHKPDPNAYAVDAFSLVSEVLLFSTF